MKGVFMIGLKQWKINKLIKKIKSMKLNRVHNQPKDSLIKKELSLYFELIKLLKPLKGHKKHQHLQILLLECYRGAAALEDAKAHYELGRYLLDEAKYRHHLNAEGVFNSKENLNQCQQEFNEALLNLKAADEGGHVAAKRLRGLCFINGWGVDVDKEAGFDLIVASIELEGSWDKVPQIFAEIGLNKPEFFSKALSQRKNNRGC